MHGEQHVQWKRNVHIEGETLEVEMRFDSLGRIGGFLRTGIEAEIMGLLRMPNGYCSGNGSCDANSSCSGNPSCNGNGTCQQ